jgi:predicted Rossmann fold flavoprotein
MMCASVAGSLGRSVLLVDHSEKLGRKILISGGGRCNFTNVGARAESFVCNNPHFAKSALSQYTPEDFIKLVEKHRIRYHEKKLGQLFCDHSAEQIVDLLYSECDRVDCKFLMGTTVASVAKIENDSEKRFAVNTSAGKFTSSSLVVATGGLSIPQIGATGYGYELARQFGLKMIPTAPALDGFTWGDSDLARFNELAGISLDTNVSCKKASFRENILFTHTGLSGPASLQISLYWSPGDSITIDLLPDGDALDFLQKARKSGSNKEVKNVIAEFFPKRFADYFSKHVRISGNLNGLADKTINDLARNIHEWKVTPGRTVGYKKAEVTKGGVDTSELSSRTMEAKKVPGLYFIGEVVDVTGMLGGYNFQWAWSSGYAAGQSV